LQLPRNITFTFLGKSRVVTTAYDGANRTNAVSGVLGTVATSYTSNVSYTAFGSALSYLYGNNLARLNGYNTRLQMSGYSDTNNTTGVQLVNAALSWGATNNNGNLQTATYANGGTGTPASATFTQTFGYDNANRLTSALDTGGWSRSFGYDAFGNMTPSGNPVLRIPAKLNAIPVGSRTAFRSEGEHPSERSDAGPTIVQKVFGFVK
jgi:hypothetical protein